MPHRTQDKGFTLIELAIALMVIGLLIGGVLKGQELIENARITQTIRNIEAYKTAAMIFKNSYGAYPGDVRNPATRLPDCTTGVCSMTGNGNGRIYDSAGGDAIQEQHNFFPHLTKAGMLSGPTGNTVLPPGAGYDGALSFPTAPLKESITVTINWNTLYSAAANYLILTALTEDGMGSARQIAQIDRKTDDGKPYTGSAVVQNTSSCVITVSGENVYNETLASARCRLWSDAGL